nr:alanine racemase [Oceanococcus sp. HetDA_MAG_MS8]
MLLGGRVRALVDLSALRHNLAQLQALAPQAQLMPVIKADAYGHGAVRVAMALQDRVPMFAVAAVSEAVALREAGVQSRICILGGIQDASQWQLCQSQRFLPVVHAQWQWEQLQALPSPPGFWLKFDTGMGRLGFAANQAATLSAQLRAAPALASGLQGVMTHLACADSQDAEHTQAQLRCWEDLYQTHFSDYDPSTANSAALLQWPQTRRGWVRPGLCLYGVSPLAEGASHPSLRPALRLEARVLDVKTLPAGHSVGYGAIWQAPRDCRVAVVAIGYADGLVRLLGEDRGMWLAAAGGQRLPLRGRISMDMCVVELPSTTKVQAGDWLGVWGPRAMPVNEVARRAQTLSYELLTGLRGRVAHLEAETDPSEAGIRG